MYCMYTSKKTAVQVERQSLGKETVDVADEKTSLKMTIVNFKAIDESGKESHVSKTKKGCLFSSKVSLFTTNPEFNFFSRW